MDPMGKIFLTTSTSYKLDQNDISNDIAFSKQKYVIISYDYVSPKGYTKMLNETFSSGLKQVIFTPFKFQKVIERLNNMNLRVNSFEFDPPLGDEDQQYINDLLRGDDYNRKDLGGLFKEIENFDEKMSIIPKKISFSNQLGNHCSIYNNGTVLVEDVQDYEAIDPIISSVIGV